ncbi:hypothetical protein PC110_g15630 [Phytophthora cactorum]|uniref:Uncharacterized protein n=1 Tax=Phytophthora cactorum TaxID=29920 RepID=A0A329RT88_9STRA|nr:hypothetical protein PC110_g15630 [Phytophthora cactorum]
MPPHIKQAKLLKQASNDKASVVEMDDKPDEDREDEVQKARRAEEDQCRRDDMLAKEERLLAEKAEAEAEERRRQDKLEIGERTRRHREDARARAQELLLLIGALTKKE